MTNVRVVNADGELDEEATLERKERPPLTEQEIQAMLDKADEIEVKYFRLRAKAIVAISKVFGKRRSEIASLKVKDLRIEDELLVVTFTLSKKRKRGLFQYIKHLKNEVLNGNLSHDDFENKTQAEIEAEWREWQKTKEGVNVKKIKSQKGVNVNSPYAQIILDYWKYVKNTFRTCVFLFPAGRCIFGEYAIDDNHHIGDRTLLNVVKELNHDSWLHLFRELKGASVAKQYGRSLESVYHVKAALDLENEQTAYHYIKRFVIYEMQN